MAVCKMNLGVFWSKLDEGYLLSKIMIFFSVNSGSNDYAYYKDNKWLSLWDNGNKAKYFTCQYADGKFIIYILIIMCILYSEHSLRVNT